MKTIYINTEGAMKTPFTSTLLREILIHSFTLGPPHGPVKLAFVS